MERRRARQMQMRFAAEVGEALLPAEQELEVVNALAELLLAALAESDRFERRLGDEHEDHG